MELLCPECRGALVPSGTGAMRCSVHGGEFKVLFNRDPANPMETPSPQPPPVPGAGPPPVAGNPIPPGMRCVQHPSAPATQQCQSCGAYMCATCDFALPNGLHLCPVCATKPRSVLGPKRKRARIWSFVCAGGATLGFVLVMAVAASHPAQSSQAEQALGVMFMFLIVVPSIVGLGLGLGSIDRRYANPASLWAATLWNGVILGLSLLLCLIGLMM